MSKPFFVTLPQRGTVTISGPDRLRFLQGLITQDIHKLEKQNILYSCLLSPQGKILHDFFIVQDADTIILDCEGGKRAEDLFNRLQKYILRANVQLSYTAQIPVYCIFNSSDSKFVDPRHYRLGNRSFIKPDDIVEENFIEWDKERILLGIIDGSRDYIPEQSTVAELNLDTFHAIDWDKGCYVGQEVTARMKYRNLGKKHLYSCRFHAIPPSAFMDIEWHGNIIGQMRSSCATIGLAVLDDAIAKELTDDNNPIRVLGL